MTRSSAFAILALAAMAWNGVVTVFPLWDRRDPLQITRATFDGIDPADPALDVELVNATDRAIPTNQIWLRASQFFTRSEVEQNGDRVAYFCGVLGRGTFEDGDDAIAPRARAVVRLSIGADCDFTREHVHLFVHVSSIGPGPLDRAVWVRDPESFARLLAAAMPHP